jgi:glycosyltransferase involved in cell wall biosynthesis
VKLAFVTPRYGTEVIGGAEAAARMLAERLCRRPGWEVEVLTSCALDHLTWENTEAPGTSTLNGVTVHRFPTSSRRQLDYFELDAKLRVSPTSASLAESRRWVALNGPMCPGLVDAVSVTDADVVACYPYLFATTVDAIAVSKAPTVLHPAAHDEPALYLSAFRQSFRDVDGFVYHTRAERDLMEYAFGIGARPQIVLGLGVNDPAGAGRPGGDVLGLGDRPYLCYLGRVDEHKGCGMLAEYFARYKERHPGDLAMAFVGPVSDHAPDHPDIVVTGTVSEADKWDILAGGHGDALGLRVLLAGAPGGLDPRGPGTGQRLVRRHHGALPSLGGRAVVRILPVLRGDRRPAGGRSHVPGPARGRRSSLHRPLLPVALDHRPLHGVPPGCRGARAGVRSPVMRLP